MKRFLFILAAMVIALSACSNDGNRADKSDVNQNQSATDNRGNDKNSDTGKTGPNDSIDGDGIINDAENAVDDAAKGVGNAAKDVIDGAEGAVDDMTGNGGNNANNNR